ncbi:hypothetical protein CMO93_04855 [Candidatus Woesearchaeota archaeon]|nr:hypothetical protein [Candidatus Woesearchaeota archaeon]|tara:strand:- start:1450 stop:1914 length:465 start_codon:yes stop_codon:yes gene_type:complete
MQDVNSFLVEWNIRFLENRDVVRKSILSVKKKSEGFDFIVHYKDNIKYFIVSPILEINLFNILKKEDNAGIFTLNNKENIRFVASKWEDFAGMQFLSIYFINPFSNLDKVWILQPYVHDKICDKSSLEFGLKSMSEMVESIGNFELEQKIKLKK